MLRPSPSKSATSRAAPRGAAGRALARPTTITVASMRGLSSSIATSTTIAQYYGGGGEGAPPLRRPSSNAPASTAPPPSTATRQRIPSVSRQPQPVQRRPAPVQMQPEPAPRAFLARSDVVDKQVIARTSGRCLGVVDHMFIDSETYRVVSVELRAKGLAAAAGIAASAAVGAASASSSSSSGLSTWGARPQQRLPSTSMQQQQALQPPTGTNLPLATLCQVGDVVLVHDERALSFPPLDGGGRRGSSYASPRGPGSRFSTTPPPRLVRLTGAEVVTADGARPLGKVRGYGFDPETGELLALRFDALGVPRIPEGAMVVTEVPISAVLSLDQSQQWGDPAAPLTVVLRPGAEEDGSIYLISEGLFGKALEKLQDVLRSGAEGDEELEEELYEEVEFGRRRRRAAAAASSAAAPAPRGRRVDPQFEAWREVHGKVFARYYGLPSVPRTRAELDRAMAAAANPPAAAAAAPAPASARQQQQQQQRAPRTRAALPPPSRGSFSDALRPADPRTRERAYEAVDAFEAPPTRQQQQQRRASSPQAAAAPSQQPLPSSWPAPPASAAEEAWREQPRWQQQGQQEQRAAPRSRFGGGGGGGGGGDAVAAAEARWGAPPPRSNAPASSSNKPDGISIMPTRSPNPLGMVRDADGGFGGGGGGGTEKEKEKGREATASAAEPAAAASPPPTAAATVVSELSFGAPVPEPAPAPAPVVEPAEDGSDGSAW